MGEKIVVASKNPVKMNATLAGFKKMFPTEQFEIEGVSVPSGISDQPINDLETLNGALNRANGALTAMPEADFFVGIEGGIEENNSDMEVFAWIVIKAKEDGLGKARTSTFCLPPRVAELIKQGKELGDADDIVFGKTNSKQGSGAVGILTENAVDRTNFYIDPVVLALIPFKNKRLYNL